MAKILIPFSWLYGFLLWFRNKLFDWGVLNQYVHEKPTIGIGNLRVGGTGKTPLVEYLVSMLKDKYQVVTLSRGYGRSTQGFYKADVHASAQQIGDEPAQIKTKFPDVEVFVDEKRARGLQKIESEYPDHEVVLLDDVFQHRHVKPHFNLLLTTYQQPFYNDHVLPLGRLREFKVGYKRADAILVTKCPANISLDRMKEMETIMAPMNNQRVFFTQERYQQFKELSSDQRIDSEQLIGRKVVLVSGIARASTMIDYISSKYELVKHFEFGDHYTYKPKDLQRILDYCQGLNTTHLAVVTTEKDAQRLKSVKGFDAFSQLPILVLPLSIAFCRGEEEDFQNMIHDQIRKH